MFRGKPEFFFSSQTKSEFCSKSWKVNFHLLFLWNGVTLGIFVVCIEDTKLSMRMHCSRTVNYFFCALVRKKSFSDMCQFCVWNVMKITSLYQKLNYYNFHIQFHDAPLSSLRPTKNDLSRTKAYFGRCMRIQDELTKRFQYIVLYML